MGFHILITDQDRMQYLNNVYQCLAPGGPMLLYRQAYRADAYEGPVDSYEQWTELTLPAAGSLRPSGAAFRLWVCNCRRACAYPSAEGNAKGECDCTPPAYRPAGLSISTGLRTAWPLCPLQEQYCPKAGFYTGTRREILGSAETNPLQNCRCWGTIIKPGFQGQAPWQTRKE